MCRHHTYKLSYIFKSFESWVQHKGKHVVGFLCFEGTNKPYERIKYTYDLTRHVTIKNLQLYIKIAGAHPCALPTLKF